MRKSMIISILLFGCTSSPLPMEIRNINTLICGTKPNCVSSVDTRPKFHLPPLQFYDPPESAMKRLIHVIQKQNRTRIESTTETTIHAVRSSAIFRFKDDLYFILDPEQQQIHFKSAARTGYSDFGVNRKQIEKIRSAFNSK